MNDRQQLQMFIHSTADQLMQTMTIQGKNYSKAVRLLEYLDILLDYKEEVSKNKLLLKTFISPYVYCS